MADITHINKNAWGPQQVLGIQRGPETQKSWRTAEVDYFPPGILILFNQQYLLCLFYARFSSWCWAYRRREAGPDLRELAFQLVCTCVVFSMKKKTR